MNLTDKLDGLYRSYGYRQFKVNKFEEYDYYARNKDFLVSNRIISFTDTNGKLMALKPDVTLSVIKNSKDDTENTQKVYYNENVYRVSRGSGNFRENFQTGLECIGLIDDYSIFETLLLAGLSLKEISEDFVLDISNLDIISGVMGKLSLPPEAREKAMGYVEHKDIHDLKILCEKYQVSKEGFNALSLLISACGRPQKVIEKLKEIPSGYLEKESFEKLCRICLALDKELSGRVNIDFSIVSDIKYYNGFMFNGFICEIPRVVLSGGQYDRLLRGMGRKSQGLGFAIYMDALELYNKSGAEKDCDVLLLYGENDDPEKIYAAVKEIRSEGKSVCAEKTKPEKIRCGEVRRIG